MAVMPMMPMMPTMGFGTLPLAPMTGFGILPVNIGTPAFAGSGLSMQMSLAMSGDAAVALAPGLLRGLGRVLAPNDTAGIQMTAQQVTELLALLRQLRDRIPPPEPKGGAGAPRSSPEVERARATVRRLAAEVIASEPTRETPDLARARATVRRLAAEATARQAARDRTVNAVVADGAK
jgi:hypothetical protein